jgi:hypothetical protein
MPPKQERRPERAAFFVAGTAATVEALIPEDLFLQVGAR